MLSLEITYLKMEIMVILPGGMLVLLLVAVSLIVNLYYVDGFTFRNNKIEMTNDYPYNGDVKDHFIYKNSKNIVIEHN